MKDIQVTQDRKILVAYCEYRGKKDEDSEFVEYVVIHNLQTNKEVNRVVLDLEDGQNSRERAQDLFIITQETSSLIMRSDDGMSIKIVSLDDGNVNSQAPKLHQKPIQKMLLMNDQQTLLTVGKDKKIIVFDIVSMTKAYSISNEHQKPINSMCLTKNNDYCFTGD
jgi:WD40 repeat protein